MDWNAIFKAIGDIMLILNLPTETGQNFLTALEWLITVIWLPIGLIMKLFGN